MMKSDIFTETVTVPNELTQQVEEGLQEFFWDSSFDVREREFSTSFKLMACSASALSRMVSFVENCE